MNLQQNGKIFEVEIVLLHTLGSKEMRGGALPPNIFPINKHC